MGDTIRTTGFEAGLAVEVAIVPTAYTDDTPILSSAIDLSTAHPRARILVVGAMDTSAHGGAFTVTECATSGGSYTAATTTSTDALTADGAQLVTVKRNLAKPFIKVTFTGDDASAAGTASAEVLYITSI